jgi:hypothetical protein
MSNASSSISGHFRRRPSHPSASRNQLARSSSVLARSALCCALAALSRYSSSLFIVGSKGSPTGCGSFENTWDLTKGRPPPISVSNTSTGSKVDPKIRTVVSPQRHTEAIRSPVRPRQTIISPAGRERVSERSGASPAKSPVRWHRYRAE